MKSRKSYRGKTCSCDTISGFLKLTNRHFLYDVSNIVLTILIWTYHMVNMQHMICKYLIEPSLKNWLEQNRIFEKFEKYLLKNSCYQKVCRGYFVFGFIKIQTVVISSLSLFVLTSVYADIFICPSFTFEIMYLRLTVS